MIKTTDNSQTVALLKSSARQEFTGDIRFQGTTELNATIVNNLFMGGRINQWIGTNNCQFGSAFTYRFLTPAGELNTCMGIATMLMATTASCNVAVGCSSLEILLTGNYNTSVGQYSASLLQTGSYNTLLGAHTNNANFSNSTCLGYGSVTTASNQIMLGTVTENVVIPNIMTTQGLVHEMVNTATGTTTAFTLNYATGGVFVLSSITGMGSLSVTNIPTDITKSYTFSVAYQQSTTHNYISTVQFQDTASAYITNSGSAGFVAPLWNGGTPALTVVTNNIIVQQFTVISVGGSRRVTSSISCFS